LAPRTPKWYVYPRLGTTGLEGIERYFAYKPQVNNRLAGIGQPTKGEREIRWEDLG